MSTTLLRRAQNQSVHYLESYLRSVVASDPYALSIIAYALSLANSSQADAAFQKLNALAISEGLTITSILYRNLTSSSARNRDDASVALRKGYMAMGGSVV